MSGFRLLTGCVGVLVRSFNASTCGRDAFKTALSCMIGLGLSSISAAGGTRPRSIKLRIPRSISVGFISIFIC